jgi:hypothetical protein
MPFDNFYEESDKARRRWWKSIGLAVLLFFAYWTVGFLIIPEPKTSAPRSPEAQTAPVKSIDQERHRRVHDLCAYLPTPEKFYLEEKSTLAESPDFTLVRYSFKSERTWDEIMPSFLLWLNANGWKTLSNNQSTFTKGNQTIAFDQPYGQTNYVIYCSEKDF